MRDHPFPAAASNWRCPLAVTCLSVLVGVSQANALPGIRLGAAPGILLVQGAPAAAGPEAPGSGPSPFADLNEVLEATRAKLEEQFGAEAAVAAAAELRDDVRALKEENERLADELQQASARRTDLESASELAEARIAELSKAVDVAVREAARIDQELAGLRRENAELDDSLTQAESAREAAQAEAGTTRAETEAKLEAATDAAEQSEAELAELRKELEAAREQLAAATSAREQSVARVSEMAETIERSGADAERLQTELAAAKEQLGQATGAAVEAERARDAASSEAASLRDEVARVREELVAAKTEIEGFETANAELEKQMASWHRDSRSALETARGTLIVMQQKIEELNAALGVAPPEPAVPATNPQPKPEPAKDRSAAEPRSPSAMAEPAVSEPAAEIGAAPSRRPIELSETELAVVGLTATPSKDDRSGLARFQSSIQDLNRRALGRAGGDLFSGVEAAGDHVVDVGATARWDSIPPAGQLGYLNTLLDDWIAAKGGEAPAAVRIVDRNGQVLREKSWP